MSQVFGQDRIAIVVPGNAIGLFHQALGMCIRCPIKTSGDIQSLMSK